ncbi:MAG: helix-turn-helix domain-containing protein, partial [Trueperaceae bacterium]
ASPASAFAAPPAAAFDVASAAAALAALGHEARLEIYRALMRAGRRGLAVHEVQERLGGMPRSTLAHHLGMLVQAGLVAQSKEGATVINTANFDAMDALVGYLNDECCSDATHVGASCATGDDPPRP